jgi:hypothetical protein
MGLKYLSLRFLDFCGTASYERVRIVDKLLGISKILFIFCGDRTDIFYIL